jgi:cytochrome d ubiquinol oxidase subunit I
VNRGVWLTFISVAAVYVAVAVATILVLRLMSRRFRASDTDDVPYGPRSAPARTSAGERTP